MCSIPTRRRTVSWVTPAASSSSSLSWLCVVDALWMASDFASPMFARWLKSSSALDERCARRRRRPRCRRSGSRRSRRGGCARRPRGTRRPRARGSAPSRPAGGRPGAGDGQRVLAVALHPQRQRLDALQEQERVERRDRGAGVAQQHGPHAADVGGGPERVGPDDAVVARVGLRQARGSGRRARPSRTCRRRRRAADRRAVAADELRRPSGPTMSAPWSKARHRIGVGTVLSTISGRPCGVRGVGPGARCR